MRRFDKYELKGAYHWEEFDKDSPYRDHVLRIKKWIGGGNILDIGAGDGVITSQIGAVGIDCDRTAVKLAKERGVNVREGNAYQIPFSNKCFDKVIMADVIEHLIHPEKALKEVRRVLHRNGSLYIITPTKKKSKGKHHYREYSSVELRELLYNTGFHWSDIIVVKNDLSKIYGVFKREQ